MTKTKRFGGHVFWLLLIIIFILAARAAHAAGQSSPNYKIETDVFTGGGDDSGSANYQVFPATGQSSPLQNAASANYELYPGFWHGLVGAGAVPPLYLNNFGDTITNNATVTLHYTPSADAQFVRTSTGTSWSSWVAIPDPHTLYLGTTNGRRNVYLQLKDGAGNCSLVAWASIILDTTAPKGVVQINGGHASVNQGQAVRLHLAMMDANMTGAKMRFKNDAAFASPADDGIAWEDFDTFKVWDLSAGTGTKKVYAQFKDGAGKLYSASDSISVVATGGVAFGALGILANNVQLNNGDTYTKTTAVSLTYDVNNPANYEARYLYGTAWTTTWEALTVSPVTKALTLSSTNGPKRVYVQLREKATPTNKTDPAYASIILDTTAPSGAVQINNGATSVKRAGTTTPVTLTIIAGDTASGIDKMAIYQTGDVIPTDLNTLNFVNFAPTVENYVLNTLTTGTKYVYVFFKDKAGKISMKKSDSISVQ